MVLILLGIAALIAPTFGFSTLASDRGVSVSVAENDRALVALVGEEFEDLPNNEFVEVASLENNMDEQLTVDYRISTDHDEPIISFDGDDGNEVSGTTEINQAEGIELNCGPGNNDVITLTVNIEEASNSYVTVQNAEMKLVFDCDEGEVSEPGTSNSLERLEAEGTRGNINEVTVTFETKSVVEITIELLNEDEDVIGSRSLEEVATGEEQIEVIDIDPTDPVVIQVTIHGSEDSEEEYCEGVIEDNQDLISLANGGFDCD
ncbi:hypothetical protein [Natrononativus amylolyticus]|uniref:hypothetical protein n=1 Tax=Natrononativus amylolyticus TaxID=2963434 RepID=UPI0020CD7F68|nr:hypothetical protein [Natrononativus amylolyticus]